ncbi:MAG TPA: lysophospholipid acyltransferase family protein [Mesorhizobium sp.]|jgi:1-acyl-sn-glycerol-3-phosphate acyltransferase|nr:lysophospholipid acyltransferase family protein [Mesorhizobium sp.]
MREHGFKRLLRHTAGAGFSGLARLVTGVRPVWQGAAPSGRQRIFFANHASHGDFILLSACLPPSERYRTRPVAAADYWEKTPLRRFVATELFDCVLVEREAGARASDPMAAMLDALDGGSSLIIFPEGTRNTGTEPLPFRSGLYNLATARPHVELVPAFIENMSRVLPKGEFLPVPLLCRVVFGEAVKPEKGEERRAFLDRAREALLALDPRREAGP